MVISNCFPNSFNTHKQGLTVLGFVFAAVISFGFFVTAMAALISIRIYQLEKKGSVNPNQANKSQGVYTPLKAAPGSTFQLTNVL